nr:unnamed protein product [Haemonchus contortus]
MRQLEPLGTLFQDAPQCVDAPAGDVHDQEVFQGYYDRPMARLQRKVNTFALPIKRIPRIGGTIVMG